MSNAQDWKNLPMNVLPKGIVECDLKVVDDIITTMGWREYQIMENPLFVSYFKDEGVFLKRMDERQLPGSGFHDIFKAVTEELTELMFREDRLRTYGFQIQDINQGWCHEWADRFQDYLPDSQVYLYGNREECGHSFIRYEDQFYDVECPTGS